MTSISVPASLEEAQTELGALGELLIAGEWHRAAIVAAFTKDSEAVDAFVALGITGLKTRDTVLLYRKRWTDAFGTRPKPGSRVVLPTDDWERTRTGTDGLSSKKGAANTLSKMIEKHGAEDVARMLVELDPDAVGEVVGQNQDALNASRRAYGTPSPTQRRDHPSVNLSTEARSALTYIEAQAEGARARAFLLSMIRLHGEARDLMELDDNEESLGRTRTELRRILDIADDLANGVPADLSSFDSEVSE
jgi:hypothetical protein